MPGKAGAEPSGKRKVGRTDLTCLRQRRSGCGINQIEPASCRDIAQSAPCKGRLKLPPTVSFDQRLSDEEPKANEEPLVDAFGTPRFADSVALDLKPDKIAQDGTWRFIPIAAQRHEPLPQGVIAMEKGLGHRPRLSDQG